MDLKTFKLDELNPASYNPRKNLKPGDKEYEKIKSSIEAFGFVEPLIVNIRDGANRIVGGHQRYKVLKELGVKDTKCVIVDYDDVTEKACNVALNKIGGDWEFTALADLLTELDTGAFDMELTGFDEDELAQMLNWTPGGGVGNAEEDDFDADAEAEAIVEPATKRGDIWLLGKHRVMCGDSTRSEDVGKLMDGKKAIAYITDPPYAVAYVEKARDMNKLGYGHSRATLSSAIVGDGIEAGQEDKLWREVFQRAIDIAVDSHAAWYVWHGGSRAMLSMCNLLVEMGLLFHQTIIWRKNNFVIGRCDYQANSEACFYGWLKGNRPQFYGAKNQTTCWDISRDTQKPDHPTQKPVKLIEPMILNHCKEEELVYDSFLGSGTTLIAAEQLNRVCYGMEISPVYCDVIVKRWETLTGKTAILESN